MTATDDLALRAREALATAQGGTLHVHGVEPIDDGMDVVFYDHGGRPTFLCPMTSPVATAAGRRRAAVLSVSAEMQGTELTSVVVAGHLAVLGTEHVRGEHVLVVGLLVHSVVLEKDDPQLPTVVHHAIPLASWTSAAPDVIGRTAERMLRHTNRSHAAQLREFVAQLRGIPADEVIAAELADLDQRGVDVRWLDVRGAHTAHVRFPQAATCANTLAAVLRETLTGGAG